MYVTTIAMNSRASAIPRSQRRCATAASDCVFPPWTHAIIVTASHAHLAATQATGTLLHDSGTFAFSSAAYTGLEKDGLVRLTVVRGGDSDGTADVSFGTVGKYYVQFRAVDVAGNISAWGPATPTTASTACIR